MRQKRISDYGYRIGHHESGPRNKITDVPGVRVGHATVESGNQHTGVTVIVPGEDNPFLKKYLPGIGMSMFIFAILIIALIGLSAVRIKGYNFSFTQTNE